MPSFLHYTMEAAEELDNMLKLLESSRHSGLWIKGDPPWVWAHVNPPWYPWVCERLCFTEVWALAAMSSQSWQWKNFSSVTAHHCSSGRQHCGPLDPVIWKASVEHPSIQRGSVPWLERCMSRLSPKIGAKNKVNVLSSLTCIGILQNWGYIKFEEPGHRRLFVFEIPAYQGMCWQMTSPTW